LTANRKKMPKSTYPAANFQRLYADPAGVWLGKSQLFCAHKPVLPLVSQLLLTLAAERVFLVLPFCVQ
jgi:hypothetical protein